MTIALHTLPPRHGRRRKRLGRGYGSGRGITSGRGTKGQRARTGGRKGLDRRALKGLVSHLPKKRGFTARHPAYVPVNLSYLETAFQDGTTVTPAVLAARGIAAQGRRGIKILGSGTLTKKLVVHAHAFSASAERAITKAGGTAIRLAA